MKTIRRDWLKRKVEQGKVVTVATYNFDDMTGEHRTNNPLPCAIMSKDWHDRKEGICYLFEGDFKSSCGRAWESENGVITLYVHSNSHFDLRVLP